MSLPGFDELHRHATAGSRRVRVAAIGGDDPSVIEALGIAAARGWVDPILVGPEGATRQLAGHAGVTLDPFRLIDSDRPAIDAVAEVRAGRADALMKGRIATPDLMRAILDRQTGLRTGETICQIVLMEIPRDGRRFLMADTGVTISPDRQQSLSILRSGCEVARRLGVESPRVAVMAATEKPTDAMPETRLAEQLAETYPAESRLMIDGPLSFDLAYSADSGTKKRVGGEVVGQADLFLFPNLLSANLCVKAIMYTANCRFGGLLAGVACPVVFMSRSDSVATRLNSLALMVGSEPAVDRPGDRASTAAGSD